MKIRKEFDNPSFNFSNLSCIDYKDTDYAKLGESFKIERGLNTPFKLKSGFYKQYNE